MSFGQKVKYKKEIKPLIELEDYSEDAKQISLRYHNQNTNKDGSLTDKAILMAYNNMYHTRVHLGHCYYHQGIEIKSKVKLDSAEMFFSNAEKMSVEFGTRSAIEGINLTKKAKKEILNSKKQQQEQLAKEKEKEKYALKTAQGTFADSRKTDAYCAIRFISNTNDTIIFLNPNLGYYKSYKCEIKAEYSSEEFIITYKLGKPKLNNGYLVKEGDESQVLQSVKMADAEKEASLIAGKRKEMNELMEWVLAFRKYDPSGVDKLQERVNNASDVVKIDGLINSLGRLYDEYEQIEAKIEQDKVEQKKLKSAVGCTSCPATVAKAFYDAVVLVDGSKMKKHLTQCSITGEGCGKYKQLLNTYYFKIFDFPKFMTKPSPSFGKKLQSKTYYTHFYTKDFAVVVKPPNDIDTRRVMGTYLIRENGSWKVLGMDETKNEVIIKRTFLSTK